MVALITQRVIDAMVSIGQREKPQEACGVITPIGDVIELPNRAEDRTDSYALDPEDYWELWDRWAPDLLVWHTHPSGFIGPSRRDMQSRIPDVNYLVVTLEGIATRF